MTYITNDNAEPCPDCGSSHHPECSTNVRYLDDSFPLWASGRRSTSIICTDGETLEHFLEQFQYMPLDMTLEWSSMTRVVPLQFRLNVPLEEKQ